MHVHISRNGQSFGPFTPAQITEMLQNGALDASDSVWIESTDWEQMSSCSWLFGSRADVAPSISAHTVRVPGTDRWMNTTPSTAATGLNGLEANGRNIRPIGAYEEEGSTNLMKDVFDL